MFTSSSCPKCGAPLDVQPGNANAICPGCGTAIVFAPAQSTINISGTEKMDLQAMIQTAGQFKRIKELVAEGNKIEAIKLYREVTNLGLAESKAAIDALEAGQPLVMSQTVTSTTIGQDMNEQIINLLRQNNKIEAVKLYRQATNLGLKEAKDVVDAIEASLKSRPDYNASFPQPAYQPTVSENPFDQPQQPGNRTMVFILLGIVILVGLGGVAVLLFLAR